MRDMLESREVLHVFHNAHHDQHSFANEGIEIGEVYDTLDSVRLLWPALETGYTLKSCRVALLGKDGRELFKELTSPQEVPVVTYKDFKWCACGNEKCRKTEKKWGAIHAKRIIKEEVHSTRKEPCPIESIQPGHARWTRKVEYSGEDAADGLELYDLIQRRLPYLKDKLPELPWD